MDERVKLCVPDFIVGAVPLTRVFGSNAIEGRTVISYTGLYFLPVYGTDICQLIRLLHVYRHFHPHPCSPLSAFSFFLFFFFPSNCKAISVN